MRTRTTAWTIWAGLVFVATIAISGCAAGGAGQAGCGACPMATSSPAAGVSADPLHWSPGRAYLAHRAKAPITIDKTDHPEQWAAAMVIDGFHVPTSLGKAVQRTVGMMLWDDDYLYVRIVAHDTDLLATYTKGTDPLFNQDVVELFLKPWGDKINYYEFEFSPKNAVMALRIAERNKATFLERAAWESGVRSTAIVRGTLNNPDDNDESYTIIAAIPWANLDLPGAAGKKPRLNRYWHFGMHRCDHSGKLDGSTELSSAALLSDVDFHLLEEYIPMRFVE